MNDTLGTISAASQRATVMALIASVDPEEVSRAMASSPAWPADASPRVVEGPYYLTDQALVRRDITEGRQGIPLLLRIAVHGVASSGPVAGAKVDVWHCDAGGHYSGHLDEDPDRPHENTSLASRPATDEQRFLRGVQITDSMGVAEFATIYPGWYYSRSIHVHVKIHVGDQEVYVGQLYLPEQYNRIVENLPPYNAHGTSLERLPNADDFVYESMGGSSLLIDVRPLSEEGPAAGYTGSILLSIPA
ncbi:intradiol ring-cleavage dioxygenase [Actinacidiphila glaucinigra]|uniref:intradiol ring-cleavage dioxygenase n=1 Tax=Actinacidiphila glaucinigra TaxID=235986 RepID=UPI0037C60A22